MSGMVTSLPEFDSALGAPKIKQPIVSSLVNTLRSLYAGMDAVSCSLYELVNWGNDPTLVNRARAGRHSAKAMHRET